MSKARSVGEIMRREFVSLQAGDRLDFVEDVMALGRIRHLPVLKDGKLVGIVSQRDLLANSLSKALDFDAQDRRSFLKSVDVSEAMTADVITVEERTEVDEAARLMIRHRIGCLPVVDSEGGLVGLVTETDLLRAAYLSGDAAE
jgi:CBS domain-containing membrane protein